MHTHPHTAQPVADEPKDVEAVDFGHSHGGDAGHGVPADMALALKRGAVIFVEASVCTHSIPVGLSLGLQGGVK